MQPIKKNKKTCITTQDTVNIAHIEHTTVNLAYMNSEPSTSHVESEVGSWAKQHLNTKLPQGLDLDKLETCFRLSVLDAPSYACTSCNQLWFKESVSLVRSLSCDAALLKKCSTGCRSVKNNEWICNTCKRSIVAGKIPECSVANGMTFPTIPIQLKQLTEVEQRLIAPRIPFMVIREQTRGGQFSLKGNVVNVPADIQKTVRSLPRMLNDDETIHVKLKRKVSYSSCVAQEMIRPNKVYNAVKYLVEKPLFKSEGITLNENWLILNGNQVTVDKSDTNFSDLNATSDTTNPSHVGQNNDTFSESESLTETNLNNRKTGNLDTVLPPINESNTTQNITNPSHISQNNDTYSESESSTEANLDNRNTGNLDTMLQTIDFREFSKTLSLAPCEGNVPVGIFQDTYSEFLSFPAIYCGEARVPNNTRLVPLHYSTIAKWEMRHMDRRVATSIPNLFYKLKKIQIKYLQDKIHLALRKCKLQGKKVTVQDILAPGAVNSIVRHNEGYQVLKNLRGSPAYWESAKKDLFALIKQLGIPTWFCSLSAAETRWYNLLQCLARLVDHVDYTVQEIKELSWQEKCRLIKSDPVTCARYFDYRVQKFLNDILLNKSIQPLGEIEDFFYRVEFQQRGSPHIHMVVWVKNAPDILNDKPETIEDFINTHLLCSKHTDLLDLLAYQTHRHARTCRQKGKSICRFKFPQPPFPKTMVLQPLSAHEKKDAKELGKIYEKVSKKLNEYKNGTDISFRDFLAELDIQEELYIKAIRWSLQRATVFLKRSPSEIRINSYNKVMLKCWSANIDVQFVLDAYSCAAYIVSYISKGQRGMSNLMYQAAKEAKENNLDLKQQLRAVGNKFLTHVEVGAQEAAYLILQMHLKQSSRKVLFINTTSPENRLVLIKSFTALEELSETSTDIESDNWKKEIWKTAENITGVVFSRFCGMVRN